MIPLVLDLTVHPVMEPLSPPGIESAPAETFDSHFKRTDPTPPPHESSSSKPAEKEEDDEADEKMDTGEERTSCGVCVEPNNAEQVPEAANEDEEVAEAVESDADVDLLAEQLAADSAEPLQPVPDGTSALAGEVETAESPAAAMADDGQAAVEAIQVGVPNEAEPIEDSLPTATLDEEAPAATEKVVAGDEQLSETTLVDASLQVSTELVAEQTESAETKLPLPDVPRAEPRKAKANHLETASSAAKSSETAAAVNAVMQQPASDAMDDSATEQQQRGTTRATETAVSLADRDTSQSPNATTSRLAQHLVSASEDRAGKTQPLTGPDQNRFLDRVARAFKAAENRQGVVKLRLHPPELGSLRIELRMQNGTLNARLEAETAVTQSLLLEHAYALRDRLSEQGIRVERFDVDLANRRSMDQPQGFEERSSQDRGQPGNARRQPPLPVNQDALPIKANSPTSVAGQINVII